MTSENQPAANHDCLVETATEKPGCGRTLLDRPMVRDALVLVGLIAITLACFHQSLGCYFHADDLMQLPYLQRIFQGHPELLLKNFVACWMGRDFQLFYRPLIEPSLALDYLFWKTNPIGYHVSNLFYQIVSSFFLFLTTRRLLRNFAERQSTIAAVFTAGLFSAYPLHAEVVTWIIGRVDGLCTAFYLISLWCFLKVLQDKSTWALSVSLGAFALGLLCKEMAAGLPLALGLVCFLEMPPGLNWSKKIAQLVRQTWMYWGVLVVYLLVRRLVLGTMIGGYSGAYGDLWNSTVFDRLFHYDFFWVVIYPFNRELFDSSSPLVLALRALYALIGITVLARLAAQAWSKQVNSYLLFALGWFVACMLPAMQVWNISRVLMGSRFIYLGSAPICLWLTLLLLPLGNQTSSRWQRRWNLASLVLLSFLFLCYAAIAWMNNTVWAEAGQEMRQIEIKLQAALRELPVGKRLVLIDFPQQRHGCHMFYYPEMFASLVKPPLCFEDLSDRLYALEPIFHDDEDLIDVSQLRRTVSDPLNRLVAWNSDKNAFVSVMLPASPIADSASNRLSVSKIELQKETTDPNKTRYDLIFNPPIRPSDYDFIDLDIMVPRIRNSSVGQREQAPKALLSWTAPKSSVNRKGDLQHRLNADGSLYSYRIAVSEHKSWMLANKIEQLKVDFQNVPQGVTLTAVRLLSGQKILPKFWADTVAMHLETDGTYTPRGDLVDLHYDASNLPGVQSVVAEISGAGVLFKQYTSTLRDIKLSNYCLKRIQLFPAKGNLSIPASDLPQSSWCQVRVAALDGHDQVIGYVSDPINLRISKK